MANKALKVLLVSDSNDDYALVSQVLAEADEQSFTLDWVTATHEAAILSMSAEEYDVCLVNHEPGASDGIQFLRHVKQRNLLVPVVVLVSDGQEAEGRRALRAGATDYLSKGQLSVPLLSRALCYIVKCTRLHEALGENEHLYRMLVARTTDIVYTVDLTGRLLSFNQAGERLTGYSREEVLRMNIAQLLAPEHAEIALRLTAPGNSESAERGQVLELITKGGRRVPVELSTHVIYREQRPIGIQGIARDVSERRAVEQLLQETNRWLNALVEFSPLAIFVLDPQNLVQMWNPAAERLFGWAEDEVFLSSLPVIPQDGQDEFARLCRHVVSEGRSQSVEMNQQRKDGTPLVVNLSLSPLYDTGRVHIGLMGMASDLTEQRRVEAELKERDEQLRYAQKMEAIGRFAGGISHDFNNLLTIVKGYSDLMTMRLPQDENLHRQLSEIKNATMRASELTRQLLTFSRKQEVQPRTLNLNETVGELGQMLPRLIGEDIVLHTALEEDLYDVWADAGQMAQVLMNLVSNARDAMPQGGELTISTNNVNLDQPYNSAHASIPPGQYAALTVVDTGHGMDAVTRGRIFEPFFTTRERTKRAGLGLATVYGIVTQSNGYIEVDSELSQGTTVKIYLLRKRKETRPPTRAQATPGSLQGKETILVLEDEESLRNMIYDVLDSYGYRILSAADGQEALAILKRHKGPLHLIVTDVVMPGLGIRDITERCVELRPDVKFLYMSGYTNDTIFHYGILTPGMDFLQKPFTVEELAQKVRATLDRPGPIVL